MEYSIKALSFMQGSNFKPLSRHEEERVNFCLGRFVIFEMRFKRELDSGLKRLEASLRLSIKEELRSVGRVKCNLSKDHYLYQCDEWSDKLSDAIETNTKLIKPLLSEENYKFFFGLAIDNIVKEVELILSKKSFTSDGVHNCPGTCLS